MSGPPDHPELLAAALEFAARQIPCVPIVRGTKKPDGRFVKNGFNDATWYAHQIEAWFTADPTIEAIAVVPGRAGFVVVDIDGRHGGFESVAAAEGRIGALPPTRTVITPGGGEHRWYKLPTGVELVSKDAVLPGVDAKALRGMVHIPPSRHVNGGTYMWDADDLPVAPLPQAWIGEIRSASSRPTEVAAGPISEGGRNAALASLGGSMRRRGMSLAAISAALHAENAERCEPPLKDREVDAIAKSVSSYAPGDPVGNVDETRTELPSLVAIDVADLLVKPFAEPKFLVRYIAPVQALIILSGDTGSAKTALAVHVAVSLATGRPVAGRFQVADGAGPVLFLNGEMSPQVLSRYVREAVDGIGAQIQRGRLIFEGVEGVASFRFSDETKAQLEDLVSAHCPSLVVIDTQRALLIEDENDGIEVRKVFSWLRSRIVDAHGATVLVLHHLRKLGQTSNNDRERVSGHRDILASVDVHLAAISKGEAPMHALRIGKTRFPVDSVAAGAEWPIEARLEYGRPGEPNRSIFTAGELGASVKPEGQAVDSAETELRALFEQGEPLSRGDAKARSGNRKRAWDRLRDADEIIEVGLRKREHLFTLTALTDGDSGHDHDPDHGAGKPPSHKRLSVVKSIEHVDHAGMPEATTAARFLSAAVAEPPHRGRGQSPYRDHELDHAAQKLADQAS